MRLSKSFKKKNIAKIVKFYLDILNDYKAKTKPVFIQDIFDKVLKSIPSPPTERPKVPFKELSGVLFF